MTKKIPKGFVTFNLKAMPIEVHKLLLRRQAKEQLEHNRKISIEHIIYKIIRENEKE